MVPGTVPLGRADLAGYGVFAFPLAMAALPVYLHAPRFYAESTALGLGTIGLVFGVARLIDGASDPLLGLWIDRRFAARGRRLAMLAALPLLVLGMMALFHPPDAGAALWLLASLVTVSLGYSLAAIAYQALVADLHHDPHQRTRLAAVREGVGLAGVMAAALLPGWLAHGGDVSGLGRFSLLFSLLAVVFLAASWSRLLPRHGAGHGAGVAPGAQGLLRSLADPALRGVLGVLMLSAGAGALTATLFPFYVADALGAGALAGPFLALYFAAGALGMPAWVALGRRLGKPTAWRAGMWLSVAAFAGTALLGPGDVVPFAFFCAASGLALGADLALASALLADLADPGDGASAGERAGIYFGFWNMVLKLALGLAAAVALPLAALLGYVPGVSEGAHLPLLLGYVALPCLLKIAAAMLLARRFPAVAAGSMSCR